MSTNTVDNNSVPKVYSYKKFVLGDNSGVDRFKIWPLHYQILTDIEDLERGWELRGLQACETLPGDLQKEAARLWEEQEIMH